LNTQAKDLQQASDVESVSLNIAAELVVQALRELERQDRIRSLTPHSVVLEVRSLNLKCTISRLEPSSPNHVNLSDRELQIALLIGQGGSTKTIAYDLGIRETTVNSYIRRVFLKLRVASRAAMVSRIAGTADAWHTGVPATSGGGPNRVVDASMSPPHTISAKTQVSGLKSYSRPARLLDRRK
jgi:DNA-binding CsgD family transcriptional regulator